MKKEFNISDAGKQIWEGYKLYKLSNTVNRAGFRLTGAYGTVHEIGAFSDIPVDTVLSHSAGMCKLISLISCHFPKVIRPDELFSYTFLAENHDIGELGGGDLPDDGTRDKITTNAGEREIIESYLYRAYPREIARYGLKLYDELTEKSTPFGQFAYLIDKLDGILTALFYEFLIKRIRDEGKYPKEFPLGVRPCILDKVLVHHRDADKLVDITSTFYTQNTFAADNFLHCEFFNPEFFAYPHLDVFFEIIQSAAYDVRGSKMKWIDIEYNKRISGYDYSHDFDNVPTAPCGV